MPVVNLHSEFIGVAYTGDIQGCALRCPDAIKTPAQIEAEGVREACLEDPEVECESETGEE